MADDDQERFEDYLELERYIEELQARRAAHLPQHLTPSQARIYRIAAQFCANSPGASEPGEQFVSDLKARLLDQLKEDQQEISEKHTASELEQARPQSTSKLARRARFISRRAMLTGGAVAAASLAVGAGIGEKLGSPEKSAAAANAADRDATSTYDENSGYDQPWLVDSGYSILPTTWHFVTTLAQLSNQAVQFAAGGVIGYVILKADSQGQTEGKQSSNEVIAMSAACTHMGCIVQWKSADRHFHCPCHNGLFTQDGQPDASSQIRYLAALPRLRVRVENDNIYVEVPKIES